MNDDEQLDTPESTQKPIDAGYECFIGGLAVILTVLIVGFLVVTLTFVAGTVAFLISFNEPQAGFLVILVGAFPLLIAALIFAFVYKKRTSSMERKRGTRIFWRTVLWTLGVFLIGGLLFFGTCVTLLVSQ